MLRIERNTVTYRFPVGKPGGNRLLGRPKRRWEDGNIKMDLQEVG